MRLIKQYTMEEGGGGEDLKTHIYYSARGVRVYFA